VCFCDFPDGVSSADELRFPFSSVPHLSIFTVFSDGGLLFHACTPWLLSLDFPFFIGGSFPFSFQLEVGFAFFIPKLDGGFYNDGPGALVMMF